MARAVSMSPTERVVVTLAVDELGARPRIGRRGRPLRGSVVGTTDRSALTIARARRDARRWDKRPHATRRDRNRHDCLVVDRAAHPAVTDQFPPGDIRHRLLTRQRVAAFERRRRSRFETPTSRHKSGEHKKAHRFSFCRHCGVFEELVRSSCESYLGTELRLEVRSQECVETAQAHGVRRFLFFSPNSAPVGAFLRH